MGDTNAGLKYESSFSEDTGMKSRQISAKQSIGQVKFPVAVKKTASNDRDISDLVPQGNPFKMPPEMDIFMMRDKERMKTKQEKLRQQKLKVHEKTTYATKINFRTAAMIRPMKYEEKIHDDDNIKRRSLVVKEDPEIVISITKDRQIEKETLAEYVAKKREMFLVQYSLGVKRDEMRKLEEIAKAEERKLELAEKYLEEDAGLFDEFLKDNDKNSVEAIKIAEQETKEKLEKVATIKKLNIQIMAIKSEISKNEDILKEYQTYQQFLDKLTPMEWKRRLTAEKSGKSLELKRDNVDKLIKPNRSVSRIHNPSRSKLKPGGTKFRTVKKTKRQQSTLTPTETQSSISLTTPDVSEEETEEDHELYFIQPQQLLKIFSEQEEQNLTLIQNSQETDETLEDMKELYELTKKKMEQETNVLSNQVDKLMVLISKEEAKVADLKVRAKLFSYGEFIAEDQEAMLEHLKKKVASVYASCIGRNEANIDVLQMLTNIENQLEELFEEIEIMPQDKVEAAEKAKEKDRRLKMRAEKREQQRLYQEERIRRALERAKAEPKQMIGKKLVYRSEPPRIKKKFTGKSNKATREEEELAYFFSW